MRRTVDRALPASADRYPLLHCRPSLHRYRTGRLAQVSLAPPFLSRSQPHFFPQFVQTQSTNPNRRRTGTVHWAPHTHFNPHVYSGGEEIYVLDGVFEDEFGRYPAHTWLRNQRRSRHTPFTGPEGALIYVKVGLIEAPLVSFSHAMSCDR